MGRPIGCKIPKAAIKIEPSKHPSIGAVPCPHCSKEVQLIKWFGKLMPRCNNVRCFRYMSNPFQKTPARWSDEGML